MRRPSSESSKRRVLAAAVAFVLAGSSFASAQKHTGVQDPASKANLTAAEATTILGQAASQASPGQVIVLMDDEGVTLGIVGMTGFDDNIAPDGTPYRFTVDPDGSGPLAAISVDRLNEREQLIRSASARARTAAFFQSNQNAFTPRTARFIIQDHFPQPISGTPGGPLYGVQFSSYRGTDVLREEQSGFPALSGDPGAIPVYKNGVKCGGIGVAGDGKDIGARPELTARFVKLPGHNEAGAFFKGREEPDTDEAVALAGVKGFETPPRIKATQVFVDGLRFPFTRNRAARKQPTQTLDQIVTAGRAQLVSSDFLRKTDTAVRASVAPTYLRATFAGVEGYLKRQFEIDATGTKVAVANTRTAQIIDSNDVIAGTTTPQPQRLTVADVNQIFENATATAVNTRALILEPDGVFARVHMCVVDRDGDLLGVFRMDDGPNFGYDVAVQKARTAAFFSDDTHAFTTRAIGFMAQRFFPIGIGKNSSVAGPLFEVQDRLFLTGVAQGTEPSSVNFRPLVGTGNDVRNPLRNGITIFPGGEPLYKNGVFVGAVGVSGDGVDQDERIGYGGAGGYRPTEDAGIRSDQLQDGDITTFIAARLARMVELYDFSVDEPTLDSILGAGSIVPIDRLPQAQLVQQFQDRMHVGFHDFRLPYIRLPRNPERFGN